MKYWFPIDLYVGGIEHAILHLVYSRFWTKVMRDLGLVTFDEPVTRLFPQGMVHKDGEIMSKSKGNTVAPDDVIAEYGADTLRLYILSVAPPEDADGVDATTTSRARAGSCSRVWRLVDRHAEALATRAARRLPGGPAAGGARAAAQGPPDDPAVTEDVDERIHLNTAVAALMELVNEIYRLEAEVVDGPGPAGAARGPGDAGPAPEPLHPHVCEEMWERLGHAAGSWTRPGRSLDEDAAREDAVELAVQVNGKVRGHITVSRGRAGGRGARAALAEPRVASTLAGKQIVKVVVVPGPAGQRGGAMTTAPAPAPVSRGTAGLSGLRLRARGERHHHRPLHQEDRRPPLQGPPRAGRTSTRRSRRR